MTIETFLRTSQALLQNEDIASARLDCLILLEDMLEKDRGWLLAHQDFKLTKEQLTALQSQVKRRASHEPLAYIRGKSEFYGRDFLVTADTLQPRPETETMIELLLRQVESRKLKVESLVDVGTGSGCLAITAQLELPETNVYATDISDKCLQTAKNNARNLKANVQFYQGDLLKPLPDSIFHLPYAIVANLPYIPNSFTINQAAMHEPKLAIFGGEDGLNLYRQLFTQLPVQKPTYIITESLPTQHADLQKTAAGVGYKETTRQDFIQLFKLNK